MFFLHIFEYTLLFLVDNEDKESEKFLNSKSSASGCCLASGWFFANFSPVLLIKVLLVKKCVMLHGKVTFHDTIGSTGQANLNHKLYQLLRSCNKNQDRNCKQPNSLKDNEIFDNKLYYYLKATWKNILCRVSPLYNLKKCIADILKIYVKDETDNTKNSVTFSKYTRDVNNMKTIK